MFKSVNRISLLKFLANDGLIFPPRSTSWIQIYRRSSGLKEKKRESTNENNEVNFSTFLQLRQDEARRTFFAKVQSVEDCRKLYVFCREHGAIKTAYHYEQQNSHVILIEMEEEENMNILLNKVNKTPFRGYNHKFMVFKSMDKFIKTVNKADITGLVKAEVMSSKKLLNLELSKRESCLNSLIVKCYNNLKISDFEIRKKFLMCQEIEILTSGFLPSAVAYPFGSSVSGFGINGSDLDIALLPSINGFDIEEFDVTDPNMEIVKKHLSVISSVIENMTNWSSEVFFIRGARVPIVKFRNKLSDLDCDLSIFNSHGLAMSQMLYTLASLDWRVRALVIFAKIWASRVGILCKSPSTKLTSFSVSVLVIFFLQQIQMLPPLNIFPCKDNQYMLKDVDFLSESTLVKERERFNTDKTLEELYKMFLQYYKTFDFLNWGISIKHGVTIRNIEKYPIYIENPIYEGINISANVRKYDILEAQDVIGDAADILNDARGKERIRRIFSLSIKNKRKVQGLNQA